MKPRILMLLLLILIFGSGLRLWQLGKIPEGFYSDEALYGYEAYSLSKTGRDQFGYEWPISVAGFGDYRPAAYIWATVPFIKYFGLTEFATRLPSALASIMTLILVFYFVWEVTKKPKIALFATLLLAISPLSLYFGRMAHETNLMTLFIVAGCVCLWKCRQKNGYAVQAMLFFAAAVYTYHSARVFVPLFLLLTYWLFRKTIFQDKRMVVLSLLTLFVFSLPLVNELRNPESWSRIQGVSLWTDPGLIPRINEWRGRVSGFGVPVILSRMLVNKVTIFSLSFVNNYLSHFSPDFLLSKGDPNGVYNTPKSGILYWVDPLLMLIGALVLYKRERRTFWWVGGSILLGLIPDALTRVAPASPRIHLVLPFVVLLSGMGMATLGSLKPKAIYYFVSILLVINTWWFWYQYLLVRPLERSDAWQTGTKEMVLTAQKLAPRFDQIWISRSGWGWIHLVFHTRLDPALWQKQIRIAERNDMGFWWVRDVGKYHLEWLPKPLNTSLHTLYIATPSEFASGIVPMAKIQDPLRHTDIYWLVDSENLAVD